jgi:hypothetical protein
MRQSATSPARTARWRQTRPVARGLRGGQKKPRPSGRVAASLMDRRRLGTRGRPTAGHTTTRGEAMSWRSRFKPNVQLGHAGQQFNRA